MNEQNSLATINHNVNITVDNNALLKIALVQLGLLLAGFILKSLFGKIS